MLEEIFQGFCMAMADSVPGVSGGSIAFLMGFYNEFITSLNNLISRKKDERKAAIRFLSKLAIGWVIGMGLAVTVLASVFDRQIYAISSLFLGFIIVAVIMMVWDNLSVLKISMPNFICLASDMILVVLITILNQTVSGTADLTHLTFFKGIYIFVAAMIAISAMVLPALMIFGFGVLTGIILFVRWIKLSLEKFPSQTMYAIIGLMIGSLYAIVMGPTTLKVPQAPMSIGSFHPLFFIVGAGLVIAMESYRHFK